MGKYDFDTAVGIGVKGASTGFHLLDDFHKHDFV